MLSKELNLSEFEKLIGSLRIFDYFEDGVVEKIKRDVREVFLNKGEILFNKDESYHQGVYLVVSGEINLVNSKGNILGKLNSGSFAGLTTFLGKSSYVVTAIACENSSLLYLPEITVYFLISSSEKFAKYFYSVVNERLQLFQNKDETFSKSFTYKPVGNYMTFPVITVEKGISIVEASKIMSLHKTGSLVVTEDGKITGILTAKTLVHKFLPDALNFGLNAKICDFVDRDVIKVPKEYPLVEVLGEMQAKNKEYALIVKNEKLIGIISNKDILKTLYNSASIFTANVEIAESLDELKSAYNRLYKIAAELIENSRLTSDVLPIISSIHIAIQKQVHKITADEFFRKTGVNICDIDHALIIMGSGARKEMMLEPDQDNGFIFDDRLSFSEKSILLEFGKKFTDNLEYVGYKKCPGNIMVTNPDMSKTLSEWKRSIAEIVNDPSLKGGFLRSSIIFDMETFCGKDNLVWELKEFIFDIISEKPVFLIQFLENDTNFKSPLSIFGKFLVEKEGKYKDMINLKPYALSIIVDVTRSYTLAKKLSSLNTIERLNHLERKHILSEETVGKVKKAYEIIVDIILRNQIKQAKSGEEVSKYINPSELSNYNQTRLKNAIGTTSKYLNNSIKYFKGHP
ncbi:MAG: putative domain and cyclic nucleotide-regulated nucleotidyltransferase [Deferribacteraceae bacterium]|nr:putative domain and cyclic nucleotide-regulated nucleotidyltransferase [Deferribacteraceae bacterium]